MKNILITEDDKKLRDGLIEILKVKGYSIDSADNGQQALEKIKKTDFDIVLTDQIMPVMKGLELLKNILQIKPNTKVIIITAFGTINDAVEAIKAGPRIISRSHLK